jgi:hypothetical protein
VHKNALQYKFKRANIPFEREKEYVVNYKRIVLGKNKPLIREYY